MLRRKEDVRTLAYLALTTVLFVWQWRQPGIADLRLYPLSLFMSLSAAIIAHNHNHVPLWRSRRANFLTNCWIGFFYGHPAIGWVPTHNQNHHRFNNAEGDLSRSPKLFAGDHLLSVLVYPTLTSFAQTPAIRRYVLSLRKTNPRLFREAVAEYAVFAGLMVLAFLLDWKKAIVLVLLPQQFALFTIQAFNYFQHIGCDPRSKWNHSRNITGFWTNALLFNNGLHTVHHFRPGAHWADLPALHAEHAAKIDPVLLVPRMLPWIAKSYLLSLVWPPAKDPGVLPRPVVE